MTLNYIRRRLNDNNIFVNQPQRLATEVLNDEALSEFRRVFAEEMGRDPFVEPTVRDIDLLNLINYALLRCIQHPVVAEEGIRSILRGR